MDARKDDIEAAENRIKMINVTKANDVTVMQNKRKDALWDGELKKVADETLYINKKYVHRESKVIKGMVKE